MNGLSLIFNLKRKKMEGENIDIFSQIKACYKSQIYYIKKTTSLVPSVNVFANLHEISEHSGLSN